MIFEVSKCDGLQHFKTINRQQFTPTEIESEKVEKS